MIIAIKLFALAIRLPKLQIRRPFGQRARRRQMTLDLLHSSPYLLRDIGALEEHFIVRGK